MSDNKKVFVLGMARSGYEAAKILASKGYDVIVNDANTQQNVEQLNELQSLGVTGTNGKTTTTTIIYEILKKASKSVFLMGNIGYPVCSFVPQLKNKDIVVMEVSDHQLCNVIDFKTNISVLTNLSEAHLDFHGSYAIYKNMKKRLFNHHTKSDIAILNLDDKEVLSLTNNIESTKKYFSSTSLNKLGCSLIDGYICYNNEKIIALDEVKIRGNHNFENAMTAISVVKELSVDNNVIVSVLKTFSGVEHRIEYATVIAYSSSSQVYVLLLSPVCASWDQFKDFEVRGNMFKECVMKISKSIS